MKSVNRASGILGMWLLLAGSVISAAPQTPQAEVTSMENAKKIRIPLLTGISVEPGPAALVGSRLYFTEATDQRECLGKDLYVYDPSAAKEAGGVREKKVQDLPCVRGLYSHKDRLFVQFAVAKNKHLSSELALLEKDQLDPELPLGPTAENQEGNVLFAANWIDGKLLDGVFTRKLFNPFGSGPRVAFLRQAPTGLVAAGDYSTTESVTKNPPRISALKMTEGALREVAVSAGNDLYFTLERQVEKDAKAKYSVISHLVREETFTKKKEARSPTQWGISAKDFTGVLEKQVEVAKWFGRDIRYLTPTPQGGLVFAERTEEPGEIRRLWYYQADKAGAGKVYAVAGIHARDVSGVGVSEKGTILISRAQGRSIDLYTEEANDFADAKTFAAALPREVAAASSCGSMVLRPLSKSLNEVGYWQAVDGQREYVPLIRFEAAKEKSEDSWACNPKTDAVAFLSKRSELVLMKDHLHLDLVLQDEERYGTNVEGKTLELKARNHIYYATEKQARVTREEAVIASGETPNLFVVRRDRLGLVFQAPPETHFTRVALSNRIVDENTREPMFELQLARTEAGRPLPRYRIVVSGDGHLIQGADNGRVIPGGMEEAKQRMMEEMKE